MLRRAHFFSCPILQYLLYFRELSSRLHTELHLPTQISKSRCASTLWRQHLCTCRICLVVLCALSVEPMLPFGLSSLETRSRLWLDSRSRWSMVLVELVPLFSQFTYQGR